MKLKNLIIAVLLLSIGYIVGINNSPNLIVERCELDHSKDYQVACVLSDICRIALDDPDLDYPGFEDLYWDTLVNLDAFETTLKMEDFENYVWMY